MHTELANCIRFLTVDAVLNAKSGHVGMCLGLADVMTVLFREFLRHDPKKPDWVNRDRVVLSNGHGSMLLYAALYLSGYDWRLDDLKRFRRLGSVAPGHPEYDLERGVEVTTGPLGQGFAAAVGMALAKERLHYLHGEKVDYTTYCFVGDGCLMEGISHEVGALAPHIVQKGLVVIWDDNGISIDGKIDTWFEKDVLSRFSGYGFFVIENVDGHDPQKIREAIQLAKKQDKPCFIQMKTIIGKGCPGIEGEAAAHGNPLTEDMVLNMRKHLSWAYGPFEIPDRLKEAWAVKKNYDTDWCLPAIESPRKAIEAWLEGQEEKSMATRKSSSRVLQEIAKHLKYLVGGSADLTSSNLTGIDDGALNGHQFDKRYVSYGVREFGMFGIANGLALSGLIPYVGTFLTFMDYGKNAVRLSALMNLRVVFVLTHDSIGLGEDGPTHQPVEQLTVCRATPNVEVWRPCNLRETAQAWLAAIERKGPTVLALSRQSVKAVICPKDADIASGAYVLDSDDNPEIAILATGSEVPLALAVAKDLREVGILVQVMSVPCLDRLKESQIEMSRNKRFVIEAGSAMSWYRWVPEGQIFSVDDFGVSAETEAVYQYFHLDRESIVEAILQKVRDKK